MKDFLCCPKDQGKLIKDKKNISCSVCHTVYTQTNGIVDLAYSSLPTVDGHIPYIWSDIFYFENILKQLVKPHSVIVEVCSGPNIIVPLLLKRLAIPVTYYSVGVNLPHLLQQKNGVDFPIDTIIGDATALPIASQSVDIYIGHHAINDIWLTKGTRGVEKSYVEMHRVLKKRGYIIQSDCWLQNDSRVGDPSTRLIDLRSLEKFLQKHKYHWVKENGGELDWVIAAQHKKVSLTPAKEYTIVMPTI